MNWLHYLLEANLYLAVFYAFYYLFLNKETHYTLNRIYLLLSCIIAFILPVMQIGALKPVIEEPVQQTYATVVQNSYVTQPIVTYEAPVSHFTLQDAVWYAYLLGIAVMGLILIIKISRLIKMTTSANKLIDNKYKLIALQGTNAAFSFFNYLFIGSKTASSDIIIRHELVHIRQKHSADIVFMELIKIVSWFNPIIYFMQMSLKTVHEYIADEQTAAHETDTLTYSSFLVNNAYGLNGVPLSHSFFNYNLLKKRIIMLNQKRSGNLARLKYLAAVPICAGMLCASTLAFSKNYGWVDLAPAHKNVPASFKTASLADTSNTTRIKHADVTTKGYKYEETGYLIDKKTDFRVIINDKGEHKEYYKSKAKPAELTMLQEKYGYAFPKMLIFPKLPPPPPAPPAPGKHLLNSKLTPPPPPAPPVGGKQSIDYKLPPPSIIKDAYIDLFNYLNKTVKYPAQELKVNKMGQVAISVTVKTDHKLTDIKIIKSGGSTFDDAVIGAVKAYNGTVGDKPGSHKIILSFFTDYDKFSKTADGPLSKDPSYSLNMFRYGDNHYPPMPHYPPAPPFGEKMPPPPPAPPTPASPISEVTPPAPPAPPQTPQDSLIRYICRKTRYPKSARDNRIGGRVILWVNINNGKIDDVKLARSLYDDIDNEVIRVLKSYNGPLDIKSGIYSLPVSFHVVDENDNSELGHAPENYTQKSTANNIVGNTPSPQLSLNQVVIVAYASKKP